MSAKPIFESNINRVQKFIKLYHSLEKRRKSKSLRNEILRLSLVMVMASLDAYLHAVIGGNLIKFIKNNLRSIHLDTSKKAKLKNLEKFIKDTISPFEFLEIMGRDRPFSQFRKKMEEKIFQHTYQAPQRIESAFELYGQTGFWNNLKSSGIRGTAGIDVYGDLDKFFERRNQIAHEMDRSRAKRNRNRLKSIDINDVRECIKTVRIVVRYVEKEFWNPSKRKYEFII